VFAPANLPAPVLATLNESINDVLKSPSLQTVLAREGVEPSPQTPQDFGDYVKTEIASWAKVIKDANIPLE